MVQHCGSVVYADQRSVGDEIAKATVHVKPRCFSPTQGSDQRPIGVASLHFLGTARTETAPIEECIPALLLGDAGDRLVLGRECRDVVRLALNKSKRLVSGELTALVCEHASEHKSFVFEAIQRATGTESRAEPQSGVMLDDGPSEHVRVHRMVVRA